MSKERSLAALASGAFLCLAASPSPLAPAFGNTIVSTYPDGRTAEIWLHPDGTYAGEGRKHEHSGGRWAVKSGKVCFHQSHPFLPFVTFCTPIPPASAAGGWRSKAPTGEATVERLVSGHVTGGEVKAAAR